MVIYKLSYIGGKESLIHVSKLIVKSYNGRKGKYKCTNGKVIKEDIVNKFDKPLYYDSYVLSSSDIEKMKIAMLNNMKDALNSSITMNENWMKVKNKEISKINDMLDSLEPVTTNKKEKV